VSFLHSFTPRSFCLAYVTLVCTSSGRKTRRRTRSTPADDMYGTLATALLTIARASSRPTSTVSFRHGPPTLTPNTGRHLDAHEDAGDTTRSSSSLDNSRTRRRECAGASGGASTSTENSRNMTAAPLSPPVPVPRREANPVLRLRRCWEPGDWVSKSMSRARALWVPRCLHLYQPFRTANDTVLSTPSGVRC